jgi:hypothetical protein
MFNLDLISLEEFREWVTSLKYNEPFRDYYGVIMRSDVYYNLKADIPIVCYAFPSPYDYRLVLDYTSVYGLRVLVFDEYCEYNDIVCQIVDEPTYHRLCAMQGDIKMGNKYDLSLLHCYYDN